MELKNYRTLNNFINLEESKLIVDWINNIQEIDGRPNEHLLNVKKSINGKSNIFDISRSQLTQYVTKFQSIYEVLNSVPEFINKLVLKISNEFNLPNDNVFLQVIDMNKGGIIPPHYDSSIKGYINYKCNISVVSENYNFYIESESINIKQYDIYCFESSLYKHWTNEFSSRRVLLSFGFIIPYNLLGRCESDPRVRMSERIQKYFQKNG